MEAALVYPLLTAASYHLGARAKITQPLWSLWEGTAFDRFLSCAACSGTWYGFGWGAVGHQLGWTFFGASAWWTFLVVGLCSMVWTPMVAALQERALYQLAGGDQVVEADPAVHTVQIEDVEDAS